jgi:hypothetical protein
VVVLTQVGNVARNRIAHILSDGSVDLNWNPNADGGVSTLAINGSAFIKKRTQKLQIQKSLKRRNEK